MKDDMNRFRQAEERFQRLTNQYRAGQMDQARYRAAINEIRLTDAQGNLWMLQEESGLWHRRTGDQWVAASPYGKAIRTRASTNTAAAQEQGGSGGRILLKLLGVVVFWAFVVVAVVTFVPDNEGLAWGIGLAGCISLILTAVHLLRQWEGEIIDIRQEEERVDDENDSYTRTVTYAYIRQPSGKVRKQRAARDWHVGDHLQKRRGASGIRKLT